MGGLIGELRGGKRLRNGCVTVCEQISCPVLAKAMTFSGPPGTPSMFPVMKHCVVLKFRAWSRGRAEVTLSS